MIISNLTLKHIRTLIFFSMLVIGYSSAQAAEIAAKVVWVKGDVKVITPTQTTGKTLVRGFELHEGDTIVTRSNGSGLIAFTDQTVVTLAKDTQLKISAYNYGKTDKSKEKYNITLLKGGLRTVTGLIAKDNRDAYQVKTPTATIGVRGTDFSLVVMPLLAGAAQVGGIVVAADSGDDNGHTSSNTGSANQGITTAGTAPAAGTAGAGAAATAAVSGVGTTTVTAAGVAAAAAAAAATSTGSTGATTSSNGLIGASNVTATETIVSVNQGTVNVNNGFTNVDVHAGENVVVTDKEISTNVSTSELQKIGDIPSLSSTTINNTTGISTSDICLK